MVTIAVNAVPDHTNCETQTSVEVCDTGVDPFHVDSTVTGFDVLTACHSHDTGDDDSVSISGMEPDSQKVALGTKLSGLIFKGGLKIKGCKI